MFLSTIINDEAWLILLWIKFVKFPFETINFEPLSSLDDVKNTPPIPDASTLCNSILLCNINYIFIYY